MAWQFRQGTWDRNALCADGSTTQRPVAAMLLLLHVAMLTLAAMELWRAPAVARLSAEPGLFWLVILFGMAMQDYLKRWR